MSKSSFQERTANFPPRLLQSILSCLSQVPTGHMLLDLECCPDASLSDFVMVTEAVFKLLGVPCHATELGPQSTPSKLFNLQNEIVADTTNENEKMLDNAYVSYPPDAKLNLEEIREMNKLPLNNARRREDANAEPSYVHKGPIFHNIFIAHRLDLAPEHTQAVVLQAMKLKNISIEGTLHRLPKTHVIIGTFCDALPSQFSGLELDMKHDTSDLENIVSLADAINLPSPLISARIGRVCLLAMVAKKTMIQQCAQFLEACAEDEEKSTRRRDPVQWQLIRSNFPKVYVANNIAQYVRDIVITVGQHAHVLIGPVAQGQIALLSLAKMHALFSGVNFVRPIDVVEVAVDALAHHVTLRENIQQHFCEPADAHLGHHFHSKAVTFTVRGHIRAIVDHLVRHVLLPNKD